LISYIFSYVCYCVVALVDDKDFALPKNKKLKLHDDQDLGDNSHHLPVPMSCDDDPKGMYIIYNNITQNLRDGDQNLSFFISFAIAK
jgi:hypothetical protein